MVFLKKLESLIYLSPGLEESPALGNPREYLRREDARISDLSLADLFES